MEKVRYRENYEMLLRLFPDRVSISPREAADVMNADIKTVYAAMQRQKDPLPAQRLSPKKTVIPLASFARWLS